MKRGRASRWYHLKVMEVRWPAVSGMKTPDRETCHSPLKKFVPPEFKEELLRSSVLDSIWRFVHALAAIISLSLNFSIFEELC